MIKPDYDARAIQWAQLFNPDVAFFTGDVGQIERGSVDSASLVEVAEHIPPDELNCFIGKCAAVLRPNSRLIVTVPSIEKPVEKKHYQHFTFEGIARLFADDFKVLAIQGFEQHRFLSRLLSSAVYRSPIRVDADWIAAYLVRTLRRTYSDIRGCGRILLTLQKRA